MLLESSLKVKEKILKTMSMHDLTAEKIAHKFKEETGCPPDEYDWVEFGQALEILGLRPSKIKAS